MQDTYLSRSLFCREIFGGIEIVFVGGAEADAFIAQEAHALRRSGCPYVRPLVCPTAFLPAVYCLGSIYYLQVIAAKERAFAKFQKLDQGSADYDHQHSERSLTGAGGKQ